MEFIDDTEALTLRNGRVSLRVMFSPVVDDLPGVAYWFLPMFDDAPMFPDHWFRSLDREIAAGQPAGSIFAYERHCELPARLSDALRRNRVARWRPDSPDMTGMFVPGGAGHPNLSDRGALDEGQFDVVFAFHVARAGDARWNCHDAGPCLRLTVSRAMLERFSGALAAGIAARVPPEPYDLLV